MSKTTIVILSALATLIIVYFIFKKKIDSFLASIKDKFPSWVKCDKQFYVKLDDGKTQSVHSSNAGTEDDPELKYYKNDVTFTEGGITGATEPIEITRDEFEGLCKFKYNPPYAWYTQKPKTVIPKS